MPNKYTVNIKMSLSVEAASKRAARRSVNGAPWDDIINFEYPKAGFIRDFRINVEDKSVKIINVEASPGPNGSDSRSIP